MASPTQYAHVAFNMVLWAYTTWALAWPAYSFVQGKHHFVLKILVAVIAIAAFGGIGSAVNAVGHHVVCLHEHLLEKHPNAMDEATKTRLGQIAGALLKSPLMLIAILCQLSMDEK